MHFERTNLAVLGLVATLSACASSGDRYPSLAVRPFETGIVPAAPAPASAPNRPVISAAALTALRGKAASTHAAFIEHEPAAARLARASAGQSVETNARAAALVAMADLSSKRGATSAVLADIDLLVAEASTTLSSDPALTAAQAEVAALLASEDAAIARLWKTMGQ